MRRTVRTKPQRAAVSFPAAAINSLFSDPRFNQRAAMAAFGAKPGEDITKQWLKMKFNDDLSDIRPEKSGYYKYYVHNFVTQFFSPERISGKRVLDFGCGPGFYSAILCQRGAMVTGVDMSPFLIEKANLHKARLGLKNVQFIAGDFINCSLQMAPDQFDYIVAIDTLVSFDYCRMTHDHERVTRAFRGIRRVLKDDGRCLVIESHPFFGQAFREIQADNGQCFCVRSPHYKIEYRLKSDVHHWFTLDEMTRATSENGLAIYRIYEPDPALGLKHENASAYLFRLKYPGMIVYEICKLPRK
jgi:SAM-dependent methyltransferase